MVPKICAELAIHENNNRKGRTGINEVKVLE